MTAIRYWLWDLRPDECEHHDWYEAKDGEWPSLNSCAIECDGKIDWYLGSLNPEMFRLLLAAITAPTEADVRGLK